MFTYSVMQKTGKILLFRKFVETAIWQWYFIEYGRAVDGKVFLEVGE